MLTGIWPQEPSVAKIKFEVEIEAGETLVISATLEDGVFIRRNGDDDDDPPTPDLKKIVPLI